MCDETNDHLTLVAKYQRDRLRFLKRLTKYEKDFEKIYREAKQDSNGRPKSVSNKIGTNGTTGTSTTNPVAHDGQSNGQPPQKRKYRKRQPVDPNAPVDPNPPAPKKRGRKPGFKLNRNKDGVVNTLPQVVNPTQVTQRIVNPTTSSFHQHSQSHQPHIQQIVRSAPTPVTKIELDSHGFPILPFTVDGFTVYSLGHIVYQKSGYHTNEYIYPVGYHISRVYGHFKHPERKCTYYCKVFENGEFPRFEITAHESEGKCRIPGPSPDYCHTTLLQFINNANAARAVDIRPQGESFFGLSNPTIAGFIQRLPNADKCNHFAPRPIRMGMLNTSTDASLNFEALQRSIRLPAYNIPEVKEEPPEDLFEI